VATAAGTSDVVATATGPSFDQNVFVNCPFDAAYLPLLHVMLFAIHDLGFVARIAVENSPTNESRLDKIVRLIKESRLSVHDLSRLPSKPGDLPRFNMPFECGLAFGVIRSSPEDEHRDMLFMTKVPYQDKRTTSDLAGFDGVAHHNRSAELIEAIRTFLRKHSTAPMRGEEAITARLNRFRRALPRIAAAGEFSVNEIKSFGYLPDWMALMSGWIQQNPTES